MGSAYTLKDRLFTVLRGNMGETINNDQESFRGTIPRTLKGRESELEQRYREAVAKRWADLRTEEGGDDPPV